MKPWTGLIGSQSAEPEQALDDEIFSWQGAEPYQRDLNTLEYHLLDTGHFALEDQDVEITRLMLDFLRRHIR